MNQINPNAEDFSKMFPILGGAIGGWRVGDLITVKQWKSPLSSDRSYVGEPFEVKRFSGKYVVAERTEGFLTGREYRFSTDKVELEYFPKSMIIRSKQ